LFGGTQPDVSRDLRRLLPLIEAILPCPELWTVVKEDPAQTETAVQVLELEQLADHRALVDATEQAVS
jgi:hypothetical protein